MENHDHPRPELDTEHRQRVYEYQLRKKKEFHVNRHHLVRKEGENPTSFHMDCTPEEDQRMKQVKCDNSKKKAK